MKRCAVLLVFAAAARVCAQPAAGGPAFETASLRISPARGSGATSFSPYGSERFTITNAAPELLLQIAFGVQPYQIVGEPKWFDSVLYDLTAKAEEGVKLTARELQPRLQRLLAERLKLAVHRETAELPGFALLVAKNGPKLKPSAVGHADEGVIYPGGLRLPGATMDWLASMLVSAAGRPVMNKTGIAGSYDVELEYAKEGERNSPLPTLFTALQERLGLKLEAETVSVEMLVIDRMERVPAEN